MEKVVRKIILVLFTLLAFYILAIQYIYHQENIFTIAMFSFVVENEPYILYEGMQPINAINLTKHAPYNIGNSESVTESRLIVLIAIIRGITILLIIIICIFKIIYSCLNKNNSQSKEKADKNISKYGFYIVFIILSYILIITISSLEEVENQNMLVGQFALAAAIAFLQLWYNKQISDRTEKTAKDIDNRNDYRDSINFLSSISPAVRYAGVQRLYDYACREEVSEDRKQEIWKILNDHVRFFTQDSTYKSSFSNAPAVDIQEIISIQSKSGNYKYIENFPFECKKIFYIEWGGAYLKYAKLQKSQLQFAGLSETQLQGADISDAFLQCCYLKRAHLQGAKLVNTNLKFANLSEACIQGADLSESQLQGAILKKVQLQGAILPLSKLQSSDLSEAQLQGANLMNAKIQGASLCGAYLQGANLQIANLRGAYLRETQLHYVKMSRAKLQGACLEKAQFQGAYWYSEDSVERDSNGEPIEIFLLTDISGAYSSEDLVSKIEKGFYINSVNDRIKRFLKIINERKNKEVDLSTVIFEGGIDDNLYQIIEKNMDLDNEFWNINESTKNKKMELKALLLELKEFYKQQIGEKEVIGSALNQRKIQEKGINISVYSKNDADQWTKDFKKAMR